MLQHREFCGWSTTGLAAPTLLRTGFGLIENPQKLNPPKRHSPQRARGLLTTDKVYLLHGFLKIPVCELPSIRAPKSGPCTKVNAQPPRPPKPQKTPTTNTSPRRSCLSVYSSRIGDTPTTPGSDLVVLSPALPWHPCDEPGEPQLAAGGLPNAF